MMWTPVLNNVAVIAVFGLYLVIARTASTAGEVTDGQLLLLGLGSTAGIAVQALALLPSLRAAGFRWRPRFDWRGSGLGRPVRAAVWTLLLVLVNQVAYWVVTRLSTSAGARAVAEGVAEGVGYTAYSSAYQLWVVPQGIITVSLVTALLPRMSRAAADGDLAQVSATVPDSAYDGRGDRARRVPLPDARAPSRRARLSVRAGERRRCPGDRLGAGGVRARAGGLLRAVRALARLLRARRHPYAVPADPGHRRMSTRGCPRPRTSCCPRAGRSPASRPRTRSPVRRACAAPRSCCAAGWAVPWSGRSARTCGSASRACRAPPWRTR